MLYQVTNLDAFDDLKIKTKEGKFICKGNSAFVSLENCEESSALFELMGDLKEFKRPIQIEVCVGVVNFESYGFKQTITKKPSIHKFIYLMTVKTLCSKDGTVLNTSYFVNTHENKLSDVMRYLLGSEVFIYFKTVRNELSRHDQYGSKHGRRFVGEIHNPKFTPTHEGVLAKQLTLITSW